MRIGLAFEMLNIGMNDKDQLYGMLIVLIIWLVMSLTFLYLLFS